MSDILHDDLKARLSESIRWAERARFWQDTRRTTGQTFIRTGLVMSAIFAFELTRRGDWRPLKAVAFCVFYSLIRGLVELQVNRSSTRRKILHDRARRAFVARRDRESLASFESRIALQEQMADRP